MIVVASQKGGAGKTTLASHLAVEAERAGVGTVVLIDMDPQGGLAEWRKVRGAITPNFGRPAPGALSQMMLDLSKSDVDLVMIDTPPAITESIAATLQHADLVVIPARASPNDLRAVRSTVSLVKQAKKDFAFVLNSAKPKLRLNTEAVTQLASWGKVAPVVIGDRTAFAISMIDGRTASELEPESKAAEEIADLWTYLAGCLVEDVANV